MADNDQYPHTAAQRINLPTLANYGVTKFEPSTKYREEEEIPDETGANAVINGIDKTFYYDIEMWCKTAGTEPVPLSKLVFTAPAGTNVLPIPGTVGGVINILVRGEVKHIGDAGKVAKVGFKGECNVNLPGA